MRREEALSKLNAEREAAARAKEAERRAAEEEAERRELEAMRVAREGAEAAKRREVQRIEDRKREAERAILEPCLLEQSDDGLSAGRADLVASIGGMVGHYWGKGALQTERVADPGPWEREAGSFEAHERIQAAVGDGLSGAASTAAWLVAQRSSGSRPVANQVSATAAGWTPSDLSSHGLVAKPRHTRLSIHAYQSRGGVKSTRSVARGSSGRRPNVRSRAQTLLCAAGAARWPRC